MEIFSVTWSRYDDSKKYTIGYLTHNDNWFFKYNSDVINEAINDGFRPFPDLPDVNYEYTAPYLFQTFYLRYKVNDKINKLMKEQDGTLTTDKILIKYIENKHGVNV